MPMLLWRVMHAALCAHWLILWCLLIVTRPAPAMFRWAEWAALGLLSGLIQPYLAAMVAGLLGATVLTGNAAPLAARAVALSAAAAAMLGGWWLSGMFHLGGTDGLAVRRRCLLDQPARADFTLRLVSPDARVAPGH